MRSKIVLSASVILLLTSIAFGFSAKKDEAAKEKSATLIAAYGTSYSPASSNVVSLLEPSSKGYWQPQSQDFGVNEGVYFQFLEPVLINFIEVTVEGDVKDKLTLQPYLDGQIQTKKHETATREVFSGEFKDEAGNSEYYRVVFKDEKGNYYGEDGKRLIVLHEENADELVVAEETYYTDLYNITAVPGIKNGNTVFIIKENETKYLNYTAKSVFLKIKDAQVLPKIKSIKIFGEDKNTPLAISIPITSKAVVSASSILTPAIAYSPENLFDSQLDMAWSTNGKETDGIDQSITVTFDGKEEIGGIIIWNGYQRSDAHFKGNGMVKKLDINGEIVDVNDTQGLQTINLPNKIKADKITLTIKEIFKSKKYKDVLISELRFITPQGQIILPQVKRASAELSKNDVIKTDITYINLIETVDGNSPDGPMELDLYSASKDTLRIRSNGSFVLYREGGNESAGISEGNWQELGKNKIRIFGKKYRIIPSVTSVYNFTSTGPSSIADDPNVKPADVVIFQSDIIFSKFDSLPKKEQENIVKFILKNILKEGDYLPWAVFIRASPRAFDAYKYFKDEYDTDSEHRERQFDMPKEIMIGELLTELGKINPIYIKSDVYTGLMIPYDEAEQTK